MFVEYARLNIIPKSAAKKTKSIAPENKEPQKYQLNIITMT
jgi:hypothetical protein